MLSLCLRRGGEGSDQEEERINQEGPVKSELRNRSLLLADVVCGEERKWVSGPSVHHNGATEQEVVPGAVGWDCPRRG